jgi:hypothetical protein
MDLSPQMGEHIPILVLYAEIYLGSDFLSSKLTSIASVTGLAKLRAAIIVSKTKSARASTLTPAAK